MLSLGGGPQATTIELAIYQALSFDYDPGRAALLALMQMACCLALVLLSQRLSKAIPAGSHQITGWRDPQDSLHSRVTDFILIALALLLLLPPLLAVIVDGLNRVLDCRRAATARPLAGHLDLAAHRAGCRIAVRHADHDAAVEQPRALRPRQAQKAGHRRWS